ncbi:biorientation of chromosomes in cell division protein 1-like 1 isoform X2 [Mytilus trossulus]
MSDSTKIEVPSKKRRALKRVMKKDKAKTFKQKRNLNTSLSSLSKSFNRSVTSRVIKQTLQSNNRQLAMTLEKTRKDLRMASNVIMDQKREIIGLQTQVTTYKHLAGLKPDEIEHEVQIRMEKYISELKNHLGKMGQQLFDATASLGEAMDLCMNVSRRSTGSCRSSSMCLISDDDGDFHHGQIVRAPLHQTKILMTDSPTRSLPQRVARLDMSIITEQSMLIDDVLQPDEMMELPVEEGIEEEVLEEEKQNTIETVDNEDIHAKTRSKKRKQKKTEKESQQLEEVNLSENIDTQKKGINNIELDDKQTNIEITDQQTHDKSSEHEGKKKKQNISGNPMESTNTLEKVKDDQFKKVSKKKEKNTAKNNEQPSKKDRRGTFVLPNLESSTNMTDKLNQDVSPDDPNTKCPKETVYLPDKVESEDNEITKQDKNRRGTFVVPSGTLQKPTKSKDRRETFVVAENTQEVVTSKSQENISMKKETLPPKSSKSDTSVNSNEDKRKTFLVPSSKDAFLLPVAMRKPTADSHGDTDVTEYFNSDMDFTEIIDNSKGIILETSETKADNQKKSKGIILETSDTKADNQKKVKSTKNSDKKGKSTAPVDKMDKNDINKKGKNPEVVNDNLKDNSKIEDKKTEGHQSAVEFRLPKPGKIVFAASRKMFDGTRERVPTKLPQRSRSKTKIKLTKHETDDSNVKSMFDFHERTPTVLKHASSVYDMSMDVSVHGEKESYGTFRDKLNSQTTDSQMNDHKIQSFHTNDAKLQSDQTDNQELKSDQNKKSAAGEKKIISKESNGKGEIIYNLPLKGCSPDIPKKTSRSRSKSKGRAQERERSESRGRSKSRGKRITVMNQDVDEGQSVSSNESQKSKSEGKASENEDIDVEISVNPKSPVGSLNEKKNDEGSIEDDRPNKSRSRSCGRPKKYNDGIVENIKQATTRSKSRGRSKARKTENDANNKDHVIESQTKEEKRSRSRGRSRTRKHDELKDQDLGEPEFIPSKTITRSKSRGRIRSEALSEVIGSRESDSEETVSQEPDILSNADIPDSNKVSANSNEQDEEKLKNSRSNIQKSRSCGSELKKSKESDNAGSNYQTGRSKSFIAPKTDLSDEDDFQTSKILKKKSRTKPKSNKGEDHPLDQLFKNARKKSFPENSFSCENTENKNIVETVHAICETPLKPRDEIIKDNSENEEEILVEESPVKIDLMCVTKRSRSRSHKLDRNQDFDTKEQEHVPDKCLEQEHLPDKCLEQEHVPDKCLEQEHVPDKCLEQVTGTEISSKTLNKDSESKKEHTAFDIVLKEGRGKRRHDSSSEVRSEKKKKAKKEDKENSGTGTSSSLSLLKKRLASLGPKMKHESMESPIKGANIDKLESKNVPSPALVMKKPEENISPNVLLNESKEFKNNRSLDEDGVTTPNAKNVLEEPRSRRRAANVCYKEKPLHAKLRREDVLAGKKLIG